MKKRKREDGIVTENQILFELATSKEPLSKYQLEDHVDKAYSNIFEATKKLLKDNWIRAEKTEPNRRNPGQKVEYYRLTKSGILAVLTLPETAAKIGTIANNYADMLILFKKWDFFKKEGLGSVLVSLVKMFPRAICGAVNLILQVEGKDAGYTEEQAERMIHGFILGTNAMEYLPNFQKESKTLLHCYTSLWRACSKDVELKQFLVSEITRTKSSLELRLNFLGQLEDALLKPETSVNSTG